MKIEVEQRMTKIADTDQSNVCQLILVERLFEKFQKILDIIAIAAFSKCSKIRKVPANSRRVNFDRLSQFI